MRRKGERPIPKLLDVWSDQHPVAHAIRTGSYWFHAWSGQKSTPLATLSRKTGMAQARISAISQGDRISRAELDALAIAWNVSAGDLIASMPDAAMVVD